MVHQPINCRQRHRLVREHLLPGGERRVGRQRDAAPLVALGNELKEHAGLGLITAHAAEVIQNEKIQPIQFGQLRGQAQLRVGRLQALHHRSPVRVNSTR